MRRHPPLYKQLTFYSQLQVFPAVLSEIEIRIIAKYILSTPIKPLKVS